MFGALVAALVAVPSDARAADQPDSSGTQAAAIEPPENQIEAGETPSDAEVPADNDALAAISDADEDSASGGIFSLDTITFILEARLALANGEPSWSDKRFGKHRFGGANDGGYKAYAAPVEANLVWQPHFSKSLAATVSASWQRNQENEIDLIEAFLDYLPQQAGPVGFQVRAGLMWPEISLEHSTGGAWDVVDTITPSAINSWVGEETKVLGAEVTLRTSMGEHLFALTGGVFGFNDTSGTLLSFRGWALHDERATAFGHFPLPPLNAFMTGAQENRTRSLIELDDRPGFYGRLGWRPPGPFGAALFYYDNRADPEAFNSALQWGWRTRFWNLGLNADLDSGTRLLAQAMTGTTIMGFETGGKRWVHTRFRSAFLLASHRISDKVSVSGRIEAFDTKERGSQMSVLESEEGWSSTVALRYDPTDFLTIKAEAFNVRSRRPIRSERLGLSPFQAQTVFQIAFRMHL